jgi:hypothetical protein
MKRRDWEIWIEPIAAGEPRRYRAHVIGLPGERQNAGDLESELGLWREVEGDAELQTYLTAMGVDAIRKQTGFRQDGQPEFSIVALPFGPARSALAAAREQMKRGPATLIARGADAEEMVSRVRVWKARGAAVKMP